MSWGRGIAPVERGGTVLVAWWHGETAVGMESQVMEAGVMGPQEMGPQEMEEMERFPVWEGWNAIRSLAHRDRG